MWIYLIFAKTPLFSVQLHIESHSSIAIVNSTLEFDWRKLESDSLVIGLISQCYIKRFELRDKNGANITDLRSQYTGYLRPIYIYVHHFIKPHSVWVSPGTTQLLVKETFNVQSGSIAPKKKFYLQNGILCFFMLILLSYA